MDNAFKTAAFPGMTTKELHYALAEARAADDLDKQHKFAAEINRRQKAANGDTSVMTVGEKLRYARTGKAR